MVFLIPLLLVRNEEPVEKGSQKHLNPEVLDIISSIASRELRPQELPLNVPE